MDADEERTLRAARRRPHRGRRPLELRRQAAGQAETGAGAAMAAAALVELAGGSAATALSAASHALQNVLGLVCDPVANRVEAPCLGRNIAGASNAIASANIALAGYDHLIPLDEVLDAHREVSESMARELAALRSAAVRHAELSPSSRSSARGGASACGSVDRRSKRAPRGVSTASLPRPPPRWTDVESSESVISREMPGA